MYVPCMQPTQNFIIIRPIIGAVNVTVIIIVIIIIIIILNCQCSLKAQQLLQGQVTYNNTEMRIK